MHIVYTLLAALFSSRHERRNPSVGDCITFVQRGHRNAYNGWKGIVEHVWDNGGFVIRHERGASLVCSAGRGDNEYIHRGVLCKTVRNK